MNRNSLLADFLADVVMTGYYLADPTESHSEHLHDIEAKCLKVIYTFQPIKVQDIASLMHTSKSRATQIVQILEKRELVERQPGSDHRVVLISTSKKGSNTVNELREKYISLAKSIETKIGDEKASVLCEILTELSPFANLIITEKGGPK